MAIPVNDAMVDTIAGNESWDSATITYAIDLEVAGANNQDAAQADFKAAPMFQRISADDRLALEEVARLWDELIAASIVEVNNSNANITVDQATNIPSFEGGVTFASGFPSAGTLSSAGIYLEPRPFRIGSDYDWAAAVHEFGHALGLQHPGDYNANAAHDYTRTYAEDSALFSIMSYFEPSTYDATINWVRDDQLTPMIYDILAIQQLYGVDTTTRTGDTTYGFNTKPSDFASAEEQAVFSFTATKLVPRPADPAVSDLVTKKAVFTIWDTGGAHDRIDASRFTVNQRIDLNPGTYSDIGETIGPDPAHPGLFKAVTLIDSIGIGFGVTIEEAIGGSGNDTIIGNSANNYLEGNDGNDFLNGGAGNDTLKGGADDDTLFASAGDDTLDGGTGEDTLDPSTGNDIMTGGADADLFFYAKGYGADTITDFAEGDRLDLTGTSIHSFGELLSRTTQTGPGNAVIDFGNGDQLTLNNVVVADLDPDQIQFADAPARGGDFSVPGTGEITKGFASEGLADGRFVTVWSDDYGFIGSSSDLHARLYNADGSVARDFLVNSTTEGGQYSPVVAELADGRFVVAWTSSDSGEGGCIRARIFEGDGDAVGTDFIVNTTPSTRGQYGEVTLGISDIAALPDGGFVATWTESDALEIGLTAYNAHARSFTADAIPHGNDFVINYRGPRPDSSWLADNSDPNVGVLPNGETLAVWYQDSSLTPSTIFGRFLDDVNQFSIPAPGFRGWQPVVAPVGDDKLLVTWQTFDAVDGSSSAIVGQLITPAGLLGESFIIDSTTSLWQQSPSAVALADGHVVVTWYSEDNWQEDEPFDIRGRIFDFSGSSPYAPVDFIINGVSPGQRHFSPEVTALSDGRFVVSWLNYPVAGSTVTAIRSIILNADGTGVTIGGTEGDDTLTGSGYDDRISGVGGDDILIGRAGPDILDGGTGIDTASYETSNGSVLVSLTNPAPEVGNDAQGDVLISIENLTGSAYDDELTGDAAVNIIHGGYGDDIIFGGGGADKLYGDRGDDQITINGNGPAFAYGGRGEDTIKLQGSGATGYGEDDKDTLEAGNIGGNVLFGDGGKDTLRAQNGSGSSLHGGDDNDTLSVDDGNDNMLYGDAGIDVFFASGAGASNHFFGGAGNDVFNAAGGTGAGNFFHGEGGDDKLVGSGNDTAVYSGTRADYTITTVPEEGIAITDFIITDLRPGSPDGTDTIRGGIAHYAFSDVTLSEAALLDNRPVFTSSDGGETGILIAENTTAVIDVDASDADGDSEGHGIVYSIVAADAGGAADADAFAIDPDTGSLRFITAPDYESRAHLPTYEVTVRATDSAGLYTNQGIVVHVTDAVVGDAVVMDDGGTTVTFSPGDGFDRLIGGAGVDTLNVLADGKDVRVTTDGAHLLIDADGDGHIDLTVNAVEDLFINAKNVVIVGDLSHTGLSTHTVSYDGDAGPNLFDASAVTSSEDVTAFGDDGNDTLVGAGGNDYLNGGNGDDDLSGGDGNDVLNGDGYLPDHDKLYGGSGDDYLYTSSGADQLDGGDGFDTATIDKSSATLGMTLIMTGVDQVATIQNDGTTLVHVEQITFYGGSGDDIMTGLGGADSFFGEDGSDILTGGAGNDHLSGGYGDDNLSGGDGNDYLVGGHGNDVLSGGDGNDVAVYSGTYSDYDVFYDAAAGIIVTDHRAGSPDGQDTLDGIEHLSFTNATFGIEFFQLPGKVADGYVVGATVFADTNFNSTLDPGEVSASTNATGGYSLPGGSGPLVLRDGIDDATGLPFEGVLRAPAGATTITPLTTLVALLETHVADPQQTVLTVFGLAPTLDLSNFDPIVATLGGGGAAVAVDAAGLAVANTVHLIASVIEGANPGQFGAAYDDAFAALASAMAGGSLDLADPATIGALIDATLLAGPYTLDPGLIDDVADIIANVNEVTFAETATGVDALGDLTAIAQVAQGALATALEQAGAEPAQIVDIGNAFTGTALAQAIALQQHHIGDVDGPYVTTLPEANPDYYTAVENTALSVGSGGVLANDRDFDGNSLTAVLDSTPSHGALTLNSDGSFSYLPDADFVGLDFFAYLADNGTDSSWASVLVNVEAPCYCPDTLILTEDGEMHVRDLKIGGRVMTASGTARPIKWIGRRSYNGRFALGNKNILPICVKAGALDDNVPRRDLWISPHHAMYLQGVLIEARDLVNGVSIVQAERVAKVEYFHVELETHDVIIAEGAWSETFIDDDSRGMFHNAHEYQAAYPDDLRESARYCAPRLDTGYEVEAARADIDARAGLRGAATSRPQTLRGHIDDMGPQRIAGWAQNKEYPEAPVCLDILVSGQLIGQTLANRYRGDLASAGLGSGNHAFEFAMPAGLACAARAVEVRRSLDHVRIGASIAVS